MSSPAARRALGPYAVAAAVVLQLVVLYAPRAPGVPSGLPVDKVVHAAVFALPVAALLLAGFGWRWVAVVALHAPVSELVQHYLLPHRSGDPRDAVADLVGVALGSLVATWLVRRRRAP